MPHAQTAEGGVVLSNSTSSPTKGRHGTIRAATLKTIIELIMEKANCGENEALKMFYESHIGKCYSDDSTGLYGQSALYVFSLFCEEKENS